MSTRTELTEHIASGDTATLVTCLLLLDGLVMPTSGERRARDELISELVRRHPDLTAALDAWADDLETPLTQAQAAVAALPAGLLAR